MMKHTIFGALLAFASTVGLANGFDGDPPTGLYKDITDKMQALAAAHPELLQVFSIGQNDEGGDIFALRLSLTPTVVDSAKIGQLVVAAHHGNEQRTPDLALQMVEDLIAMYENVSVMDSILADTEWTIIPVLNISGYNDDSRHEHNIDSNRDYPGPCTSAAGGKLKSIRTLMGFIDSRVFTGTITVHGYIGTMTYPWGVATSNVRTNDHDAFQSITARAAAINNYGYGTSTDIVYPADGTYEDYVYWKHGLWSLLIELRDGTPPDITATSQAAIEFFTQINSTPSNQHQMTGRCQKGFAHLDRGDE